jgi:hypothetical protein
MTPIVIWEILVRVLAWVFIMETEKAIRFVAGTIAIIMAFVSIAILHQHINIFKLFPSMSELMWIGIKFGIGAVLIFSTLAIWTRYKPQVSYDGYVLYDAVYRKLIRKKPGSDAHSVTRGNLLIFGSFDDAWKYRHDFPTDDMVSYAELRRVKITMRVLS